MKDFKNTYRSASSRLKDWDYSQDGSYFVTICTKERVPFFGQVENYEMRLNKIGHIAKKSWESMTESYGNLVIDEYIIMPDHIHLLFALHHDNSERDDINILMPDVETRRGASLQGDDERYRSFGGLKKNSVSSIINHYKGSVTKKSRILDPTFAWQPRFFDRIIGNEREHQRIQKYIFDNPEVYDLKVRPDYLINAIV